MSADVTPPRAPVLILGDRYDVADLDTFVTRAKAVDPGGAIRLHADGTTLALTVCVLTGSGLTGAGTILGMRALTLADPAHVDAVVALDAVADRLARMRGRRAGDAAPGAAAGAGAAGRPGTGTVLSVPPAELGVPWAGVAPPRSGWVAVGRMDADSVVSTAHAGIAEVSQGVPAGSGAQAVADLRRRVWGRPADDLGGLPAGAAFAAYALGFVRGGAPVVDVYVHGRWVRLSTSGGHVLARR